MATTAKKVWQGARWIRRSTRQAIYHRDGFACVYCGAKATRKMPLTLDHVVPRCDGGSNRPENLVTCCWRCNTSKGDVPLAVWAEDTATVTRVRVHTDRPLNRAEGRRLANKTYKRGCK